MEGGDSDLRLLFTTGLWDRLVQVDASGTRHLVTRIPLPVAEESPASIQQVLDALTPFQSVGSTALPKILEVRGSSEQGVDIRHRMPFGGTRAELWEQAGPLRTPLVAAVASSIAEALDALHDAGLFHGSLASDRVLLSRDCELTMLDAPLVTGCMAMHPDLRFPDSRWEHVHPQAAYTAPELIGGGEAPGRSADVFALSVLVASLLIGRSPWPGRNTLAIHTATRRGSHTLESDLGGILDATGVGALSAGMSPDPGSRPERASELIAATFRSLEDPIDLPMAAAYCGRHLSAWNHDARLVPLEDSDTALIPASITSRRDRLHAATIALESARRGDGASSRRSRSWVAGAVVAIVAALALLFLLLSR